MAGGVFAILLTPGLARAAGEHAPNADTSNGVAPVSAPAAPPAGSPASTQPKAPQPASTAASDAQRFCRNVTAAAAEARNAWQVKKLDDLQVQVAQKITELEEHEASLKELLARRDDALKRADATLVGIFAKMKPDVAAAQISALDDDIAAAVLQQLNPRAASAILDEITPDRAAKLVTTIAGPAPADGKKS